MTIQEFCKGLRKHFKITNTNDYLDPIMLQLKKVSLDIFKMDDWLHEQFDDYDDETMSMNDIITAKFGKDAVVFCEKAI